MHSANRTALLALSLSLASFLPMAAHVDGNGHTLPTEQRQDQGIPMDDDRVLTATLQSRLQWDGNTDGINIRVHAQRGAVTLSGVVQDIADKRVAVATARNTPGVRAIDASQLRIGTTNALEEARWVSTSVTTDRGPTLRL